MPSVAILEGVTGAGKTSTIDALLRVCAFEKISEDEIFDDFMTEFHEDAPGATRRAVERLESILDRVRCTNSERVLLERFHHSFLALGAEPKAFAKIEGRCEGLGCRVVVLAIPDAALAQRSLYRAEYDRTDWQDLGSRYGSEEGSLEALRSAQAMRLAAIRNGRLPSCEIDTSEMDWDRYAAEIVELLGWGVSKG